MATSSVVGLSDGGEGHVRFTLIENQLRTNLAIRNLRKALTRLDQHVDH